MSEDGDRENDGQANAAEASANGVRWVPGRNGGMLRHGVTGNRGPQKATRLVREGLLAALNDPRGGSGREFWTKLKCGSAEDRRTFANICSRLLPVEISADIDTTLTVVIQKFAAVPSEGGYLVAETARRVPIAAPNEGEPSTNESE